MQSKKPRRNKPHPKLVKRANTAYWNIRYYDENGKRKFHSTTTTDEKIALGELADFIKLEEQGRLSVAPSVQEAVDFYVSVKKQAGLPANILKTPKVIEYFKDVPANIISKEMCREYIAWRTAQFSVVRKNEKIKLSTAGRELRLLGAAINLAASEKFCPYGSVFDTVEIPEGDKPHLTKEQARMILDACPTFHLKLFILIALTSGHRMSAILDLQWNRVVGGSMNFIDPAKRKTKKRRGIVPILPDSELSEYLGQARLAAQTDYVIEFKDAPVTNVRKGIQQAGKRVGIDFLNPHILKHTACVWMAQAGVPIADIAQTTATSIRTIEKNYLHFTPDRGLRAVSATQF